MSISTHIRNLWREVEDILTAATGPLLIISSAISTSDIFSNETFSKLIPQLPAIWAIGRALAVTMWLGIAFEFYLDARRRGASGSWWFLLSMILFVVDLQTATLFAFQAEHISNLGEWAILQIPPIDWAIEQAVLGVILIAVHRAVIHQAKPTPNGVRPNLQHVTPGHMAVEVPVVAPVATRAYWNGPLSAIVDEGYTTATDPRSRRVELVSEEEPEEPGVTRRTPPPPSRPRRRDSGRSVRDLEAKKQRVLRMLVEDPAVSITAIAGELEVSRPTAIKYRDEMRRKLWVLYPDQHVAFADAWKGEWTESV